MLNRIKKIQTQIGLMHNEVEQLKAIGKAEGWQTTTGALQRGTIIWELVMFFLRLWRNEHVKRYLKERGQTLTSLIESAVLDKVKK